MDIQLDYLDPGRFKMLKQTFVSLRNLNVISAYRKLIETMPTYASHVELSRQECQDLLGLISTLEEENRRLVAAFMRADAEEVGTFKGGDDNNAKSEPD